MKRNCFLFRSEWLSAMEALQTVGGDYCVSDMDLFYAIYDYATEGKRLENAEPALMAMMELIYPQIDKGLEELRKDGTLIEEE